MSLYTLYGGERPMFESHHKTYSKIRVTDGESAIKEGSYNKVVDGSLFEGRYPLWHQRHFLIKDSTLDVGARAAAWYCSDFTIDNCNIKAPKMLREIKNLKILESIFSDTQETIWKCTNVLVENSVFENGTYVLMDCHNVRAVNSIFNTNYPLQYAKNVYLENCTISGKDMLWEADNVILVNCTLVGEFLAWHSRNVTMINCHINGTQPLCYCDKLTMIDCTMGSLCDLAFEYSSVEADIRGSIVSVKNPRSGFIHANYISDIVIDENIKAPGNCSIKSVNICYN